MPSTPRQTFHQNSRRIPNSTRPKPTESKTRPEIIVRKLLAGTGFRYRLHAKSVQGCPDIASARRRIAIFVHGCFWHGHHCPAAKLPKSNFAYWRDKRTRNVARDKKNVRR